PLRDHGGRFRRAERVERRPARECRDQRGRALEQSGEGRAGRADDLPAKRHAPDRDHALRGGAVDGGRGRRRIPRARARESGYRGHVFWDTEIFILPFFTYTQPAIARNLLLYRYHTLGGARSKAREAGYKGAQYPWEAAMTGEEVTPKWVPGPDGNPARVWTG